MTRNTDKLHWKRRGGWPFKKKILNDIIGLLSNKSIYAPPQKKNVYNAIHMSTSFLKLQKMGFLKIESITQSCMLDSQESSMKTHHLRIDRSDHTKWKIHTMSYAENLKQARSMYRLFKKNTWKTNNWCNKHKHHFYFVKKITYYITKK